MTGNGDGRKNAGGEGSFKRASSEHPAGGVLHQRRKLPFSTTTMAVTGFAIAGIIGYLVLYANKKPEASAKDVAKVSANVAKPEDTHPRK